MVCMHVSIDIHTVHSCVILSSPSLEKSLSLNGKAAMATQADSSEQAMEEMETGPSISVSTPDGEPANGSFLQDFSASNSLNFSRSTSEVSGTNDSLVLPEMEYSIATHFVKVKRSGTLTDVTTLWDLVGTDAMSGSMDHLMDVRPGFERLPSINAFDRVRLLSYCYSMLGCFSVNTVDCEGYNFLSLSLYVHTYRQTDRQTHAHTHTHHAHTDRRAYIYCCHCFMWYYLNIKFAQQALHKLILLHCHSFSFWKG